MASASAATPTDRAGVPAPSLRLNNIAELRLFFAASVMFSHAALLRQPDGMLLLRIILNSEAAVQGFFILSGFLVSGSFARLHAPQTFWRRRFWRIYPGYAVAVLFFAMLAMAQAAWLDGVRAFPDAARYFAANFATLNFLQPTITGVFADNPMQPVNGALWSIKVELMFYAILPFVIFAANRFGYRAVVLALILAGTLYWPALQALGAALGHEVPGSLRLQLPGQLHYFGLGVALFAFSKGHLSRTTVVLLLALMLLLLFVQGHWREALQASVLVAIIAGVTKMRQLPSITGERDLSYGIYLSHFPIIQILLAFGAGAWPTALYFAAVVACATAYALASWHGIEKPALSRWGK